MRIAIDASAVAEPRRTGIGNYVRSLLRCLSELDTENQYYICHRFSRLRHWGSFVRVPRPNFHNKIIHEPFNPFFMRRLDVFHGPDARLPRSAAVKKVVTCHDIASLLTDAYADEKFRRMKVERYEHIAGEATRIIATSESTRRDMARHLRVDARKITVIPLGVSDDFHPCPPEEVAAIRARLGLEKDFLLSVGVVTRRKNTRRVIEAFHAVSKGRDIQLVLAGRRGYGWQEELAPIEELGLKDKVRLLGYVPDEDLPPLYSAARAVVFPSLYEGFGIPLVEAMACGTPVVTSNCSSLPEVAGDAALLVDPYDTEAIAEAVRRLLDDDALRQALRARGIERAKLFPWTRTARDTLQVYREAAGA